jgi:hypothetical protein
LAQHRKQRQKSAKDRQKEEGLKVVVEDFFEVEDVIGVRRKRGKREYLIKWKGMPPNDNTWEPSGNLCDSAHRYAVKFIKEEETRRKRNEEGERMLGIVLDHAGSKVLDLELTPRAAREEAEKRAKEEGAEKQKAAAASSSSSMVNLDMDLFQDEVVFQEVERLDVNGVGAKSKVTEARINGTPIVLTGHRGWPQFATRWLKPRQGTNDEEPLDLSQPHEVDIGRMIEDIGEESVPILKKNYDERNPIHKEIFAKTFLQKCWPNNGEQSQGKNIYLHQWQFPRSNTAGGKLCGRGKCIPLPNDIFLEDLLQYWLDRKDNPFQYIFMGDANTMSKLHKDNGGLAITIAPIVGEKECVLAHRLDGEQCLYNLDSKLDDINLDKFPMTAFARIWKTVIRPGEILVMPYGTYHQCRNVTPCLSYHR